MQTLSLLTCFPILSLFLFWTNHAVPRDMLLLDMVADAFHAWTHVVGNDQSEFMHYHRYYITTVSIFHIYQTLSSRKGSSSSSLSCFSSKSSLERALLVGGLGPILFSIGGASLWVAVFQAPCLAISTKAVMKENNVNLNRNIIVALFVLGLGSFVLEILHYVWMEGAMFQYPVATALSARDLLHGMAHSPYTLGKFYVWSRVYETSKIDATNCKKAGANKCM